MILFEDVVKKYRGSKKPALDGVSMNIERGEFVFLVGASGSGKSSCLRMMLREDKPTSGEVHVLGQNLGKISSRKVPFFRRNLGVVFQDFRLLANKTVFDNVAFSLQVIGKSRGFIQEAVPDVLELVGLKEKAKRLPHELSGGEQQRVAIARALVNKPAILLADEPTGNLDPATSLGIMQLLRAINAAGTTVVMATHEAIFVDVMQQRVIELQHGKIVRDEIGGGYGHTAAMPTLGTDEDGREDALRASEDAVRQALAPAAAATIIASPDPNAEQIAEPAFEPIQEETLAASFVRPVQSQDELIWQDDSFDPPTEDTLYIARVDTPDEDTQTAENRIPFFLQGRTEIDPLEIAESGGFAKHLGLDDSDDDGQGAAR